MNRPPFVDHGLELLAPLGTVSARRMFGGWALYIDGLCTALVLNEQFYLKTDASTRAAHADAGCAPFAYAAAGRTVETSYWTVPADALESPVLMQPWARRALQAAVSSKATKGAKAVKPGAPSKAPAKRRIKPGGPAAPG